MLVLNEGASFGLRFPALQIISCFLIVFLVVIWWRQKSAWGFGLMAIGGGLNLFERLAWGGVRDYWQIPFTNIYNNVNDYLIFLGLIQLIWYIWKKKQK